MSAITLLAPIFQDEETTVLFASLISACCGLIVAVVFIAAQWKVFAKAGQPGWAAIVPIYNWYIMQQIVGRETWWLAIAIFLLPVWQIVIALDMAKSFGKDTIYGVLLIIFPPTWLHLGFGDSQYVGPEKAF